MGNCIKARVVEWYTCLPAGRHEGLKMYYVYLLKSESRNFVYKGLTDNLERRISQHNSGRVRSTKNKMPLKLIHFEKYATRTEAREREKYFKSGIGREEIDGLLKQ